MQEELALVNHVQGIGNIEAFGNITRQTKLHKTLNINSNTQVVLIDKPFL